MSSQKVKKGEVIRFEIESSDQESGLQNNFYLRINKGTLLPTLPQFSIPFIETGTHTLTARVFDNAGNYSENSVSIIVEK